jgi:uncharacterized membrane protein YeaQ/YmgE (transglycosylase-associated protein family)
MKFAPARLGTLNLSPRATHTIQGKEDEMTILWWILVGLVAGWITGKIMKGGGYGFWMDIILGIVGALVGGFIARAIGLSSSGGLIYTILIAIVGSIIVVFLFRLITGKRTT